MSKTSLSAPFGIDRASAREMPPLNPPQVSALIVPLEKFALFLNKIAGNETASILTARVRGIAIIPKMM